MAEARRTFDAVIDRKPPGYVTIAAGLAAGEAAELAGDYPAAIKIYERIAEQKAAVNEDVLSRLGRAALAAGDRAKAAQAFLRVYYEFPLTDAATAAGAQLASLQDQITPPGYKADLGRAQIALRRAALRAMRAPRSRRCKSSAEGDDKELVSLRIAECDFYLKRYAAARDGVQPYLERRLAKGRSAILLSEQPARAGRSRSRTSR